MMEGLYIFLGVNALIGLVAFEWAWAKVKTIQQVDETRDSQYPAFRRLDAKNWRKWHFYLGAITLMPIRLIISVIPLIVLYIYVR